MVGGDKHKFGKLYYQPTILTGVQRDMDCFAEEIFGPIVSVLKFDTEEEAINIANDCNMGLAAYCWRATLSQWMIFGTPIGGMGYAKVRSPAHF